VTDLVDTPTAPPAGTAAPTRTPAPPPAPARQPAPPAQPAPTDEATDAPEHEVGLGRSLVVGGLVGFLIVYAIAFGLFAAFGGYGLGVAAGASVFVGLFGGIGFGAMVAASIR
jgi:hypothetical protein